MKIKQTRLINGGEFLDIFNNFRIVEIGGHYGSGKTLFGVYLCAYMLATGKVDRVVSNIPMKFSDDPIAPLKNSAILLDESWIYIDTRSAVYEYAAFVRKFNHYLILPSVWPVHRKLGFFRVRRIFNAYSVGIPAWLYQWSLAETGRKTDKGYFLMVYPSAMFGTYPTEFVPGDDQGISDVVYETAKLSGYKGRKSDGYRKNSEKVFDFTDMQDELDESTSEMADLANDLKETTRRIQKVRRK